MKPDDMFFQLRKSLGRIQALDAVKAVYPDWKYLTPSVKRERADKKKVTTETEHRDITLSDRKHGELMEKGSTTLARAMENERRGWPNKTSKRLIWINSQSTTLPQPDSLNTKRRLQYERTNEPEPKVVKRDPCFACGVPADRHHESGCKRWRAL